MNESIVVALDLTDHDLTLIKYAKQIQQHYQTNKIHFVHNIKTSELDELIADMMEDLQMGPVILRNLESKIQAVFSDPNSYELTLLEGDNTEFGINEWLKRFNRATTVIMGWKTAENGTGAMAQKFIRMFQGDVLLVPSEANFRVERLLIPTDLSSNFTKVKRRVETILANDAAAKVWVLKAYNIPSVFFPFIDSEATKLKAEKLIVVQYDQLKKKLKIADDWHIKAVYQKDKSISDVILRENKSYAADMIVMSAKGSNTIAAIFLGSTTNELINREPFQCVYIVK